MTDKELTAIRIAERLRNLTALGKLKWQDGGQLGPWGTWPGRVLKARVEDGAFAQIAEIPVPNSSITSYYLGIAEGGPEVFEVSAEGRADEILGVFAEGYPVDPSDEKTKLLLALKELYLAARENVRGTWQKVERFEQVLEKLA
jgi:hypothetical protein